MKYAMFVMVVLMVVPSALALDGGWIATTVINRGADIAISRDNNRTAVIINDRNSQVWERQQESWERIEARREETRRMEIEARVEQSRNREANRAYETAARTGKTGTVTAGDGTINTQLNSSPSPSRDWSNFRMPQQRYGSAGPNLLGQ